MQLAHTVSKQIIRKMSLKMKFGAPERNKTFILQVLQKYFNTQNPGNVLEISSGSGQHVSYFAEHFPNLSFQPSEYDTSLFNSIKAYAEDTPTKNVKNPIAIDVTKPFDTWNLENEKYDYIININMMHIAHFDCAKGLFRNASNILVDNGFLITYGPYAYDGKLTPQSNIDFDKHLRSQDPDFGIRDIKDLEKIAERNGIKLLEINDLPANNKCLIWKYIGKHQD